MRRDSPVVREWTRPRSSNIGGRKIEFKVIGYNASSNLPPTEKPLKIYIFLTNKQYPIDKWDLETIANTVKNECSRCHSRPRYVTQLY